MALRDFINRVKEGVEDTATLDVITVRGTIELPRREDGKVDFDRFFDAVEAALTIGDSTHIRVLAATRQQFDKDTKVFIADELTEEDKAIIRDIHHPGVETAIRGRENFIKLATGTLDAIIPG